jgi:UDP-N-acetylmuramoyl-tripeptide--D-alanyl-D-alanine ligase
VGVCTDSRQIKGGELFVPLAGPRFDGHDFIEEALAKGAAGSLIQRSRLEKKGIREWPDKFVVRVEDVLRALGDLARSWHHRYPVPVVAITGSNGKTTTKEMTALILGKKYRVLKTEGNWNNLIGLPLMLLKLAPEHGVAVLEMGMSAPGEIRRLRAIAEPKISTICNIGHAHLEFLEDIEGVARAKGELWEGVEEEDWIAVNLDDPKVVERAAAARCRKVTFGILRKADLTAQDLSLREGKGIRFSLAVDGTRRSVQLSTFGKHHVYNALAAAALAKILEIRPEGIVAGLEEFQPLAGRGKILRLGRNIHIMDESYNANPDSLQATLEAFEEAKGKSRGLLVLGDMLEMGSSSSAEHAKMGEWVAPRGLAYLIFFGERASDLAKGAQTGGAATGKILVAPTREEAVKKLEEVMEDGDWLLVKGSRAMRMEGVIQGLEDLWGRG